MLGLTIYKGETIVIGGSNGVPLVGVRCSRVQGDAAMLAFDAPPFVSIDREKIRESKTAAGDFQASDSFVEAVRALRAAQRQMRTGTDRREIVQQIIRSSSVAQTVDRMLAEMDGAK